MILTGETNKMQEHGIQIFLRYLKESTMRHLHFPMESRFRQMLLEIDGVSGS